jgi:solute carrier family 25 phosphate transporter 23/24/25/41
VIIPPTDETSHHAIKYLLAGGISGAVSRTCTAPFDRLKVYLITDSSKGRPLTLLEAIRTIYAKGGWRGFFVGNGLNIFKIVPESGKIKRIASQQHHHSLLFFFGLSDD